MCAFLHIILENLINLDNEHYVIEIVTSLYFNEDITSFSVKLSIHSILSLGKS